MVRVYRPAISQRYNNLVVARPSRMAPLASRGYQFPIKERKTFDIATTTYQVNTTGSFTLLSVPVPGTDYTNRIGRKITNKSIYIRGRIQLEWSLVVPSGSPAQLARMIIFVDQQPNGAVPIVTDLLNNATPEAQLNLNNRDRFRVFCDKQWTFDPVYSSAVATQSFGMMNHTISGLKKYKKLNLETVFNAGTAGTIADINSGALYMFWLGSAAAGTMVDCNAIVSTRVRFDDA